VSRESLLKTYLDKLFRGLPALSCAGAYRVTKDVGTYGAEATGHFLKREFSGNAEYDNGIAVMVERLIADGSGCLPDGGLFSAIGGAIFIGSPAS